MVGFKRFCDGFSIFFGTFERAIGWFSVFGGGLIHNFIIYSEALEVY